MFFERRNLSADDMKASNCVFSRQKILHGVAGKGDRIVSCNSNPSFGGRAMNWDEFAGKWKQLAAELKSKWAKLTHDDWKLIGSKKDALVGKLQERYGHKKETAE